MLSITVYPVYGLHQCRQWVRGTYCTTIVSWSMFHMSSIYNICTQNAYRDTSGTCDTSHRRCRWYGDTMWMFCLHYCSIIKTWASVAANHDQLAMEAQWTFNAIDPRCINHTFYQARVDDMSITLFSIFKHCHLYLSIHILMMMMMMTMMMTNKLHSDHEDAICYKSPALKSWPVNAVLLIVGYIMYCIVTTKTN